MKEKVEISEIEAMSRLIVLFIDGIIKGFLLIWLIKQLF